MDPPATVLQWSQWVKQLPPDLAIMRMDDGETDGFFNVEAWLPDDTKKLAAALLLFPPGSTVEEIINEVDEELGVRISIPKE